MTSINSTSASSFYAAAKPLRPPDITAMPFDRQIDKLIERINEVAGKAIIDRQFYNKLSRNEKQAFIRFGFILLQKLSVKIPMADMTVRDVIPEFIGRYSIDAQKLKWLLKHLVDSKYNELVDLKAQPELSNDKIAEFVGTAINYLEKLGPAKAPVGLRSAPAEEPAVTAPDAAAKNGRPEIKSVFNSKIKQYEIFFNGTIVMRSQGYIAGNTVENLNKAMFTLEPGKKPVVSVKLRSIVNGRTNRDGLLLTLYINDVEIRTVGIGKPEEMHEWAKNISGCLNGVTELTGIRDARICASAAQHLGEKYVYGVNDCSYYARNVFSALGKRTSPAMMAYLKSNGIKELPSSKATKPGDIIIGFIIAQKDRAMPDGSIRRKGQSRHVFWAIKLDDGRFLFSENVRGGPRFEIRGDAKYRSARLFSVNDTFVDASFRTFLA